MQMLRVTGKSIPVYKNNTVDMNQELIWYLLER